MSRWARQGKPERSTPRTVAITNDGSKSVAGPILLVLPYNNAEVSLINGDGSTFCSSSQHPFVVLDASELAPNEADTLALTLNVPSANLNFLKVAPQVLAGHGAPALVGTTSNFEPSHNGAPPCSFLYRANVTPTTPVNEMKLMSKWVIRKRTCCWPAAGRIAPAGSSEQVTGY